jgi:hypothetical protein
MSYLDSPRIHFSGQFQADPSTVNNTPSNFDTRTFGPNSDPSWNPKGSGAFRLLGCTVRRIVYSDGTWCEDPAGDPIVGAIVTQADDRVTAKIVDLDSEQQMVSEIWGLQVRLVSPSGQEYWRASFEIAAFTDLWLRALGGGGGDAPMAGVYQSRLTGVCWTGAGNSRLLRELNQASPNSFSIKFNVDGFSLDSASPLFTVGRAVGSIGPYFDGEPDRFVAGRLLRPTTANNTYPLGNIPPVYFIPGKVATGGTSVTIDLGNALPTDGAGGPIHDSGKLRLAILPPHNEAPEYIGEISGYTAPDWYTNTAGVVTLPLSRGQNKRASSTPFALLQDADPSPSGSGQGLPYIILAAENQSGGFLRADQYVFRMSPGERAQARLLALRFGRPAANERIYLGLNAGLVNSKQNPFNPNSLPLGVPESALRVPPVITTDSDGWAEATLTAADPGNPRGYIDGQVYGVAYSWEPAMWPGYNADPWNFLSVLVWNQFDPPAVPRWADVEPILRQYKNLYPIMGRIVNLADLASVQRRLDALRMAFSLPVDDPNSMPATRDLSPAKRRMLLAWLNAPELLV